MKITIILQHFKEFADQKFSINHLHNNSDKLSVFLQQKLIFTAAQILNFIYKSLDVVTRRKIFLCSRKEKLFKESKKEYFMADEDTFFFTYKNFIIIIIFLFGYE